MKVVCILCDRFFEPDRLQTKKLHKHPHRIQICTECHDRISEETLARQELHSND
ncbi:Uncharacterized protein YlaI [Seinonella peptonophila]|uniref:Uncharacterized protein YlaI n=1 Tax=Seinonella peptonophila TaxID=112248 RepID=A0A1M4V116_9BACL|nr:DUF2197 domain-containing protein [Seinonella peptonophila]SHE62619.1 Uncharacterized protein YlaI [Seinonella peptonophila]